MKTKYFLMLMSIFLKLNLRIWLKVLGNFSWKILELKLFFQAPTTAIMLKFMNQKETNKFEFTKTAKKCSFNFGKTFAPKTED